MQKLLIFLLLIAGGRSLATRDEPHWLRYCAISPDGRTIAFTYRGQLYTVPSSGGKARRLTRDPSYHFMPVWSHDGKQIAFSSDRYGNFDLFIIPATGGESKRLTVHSADEYPYDFADNDSTVLFGAVRLDAPANRAFPSDALPELYRVPSRGGRVEQVLTTAAEDARVSPSGRYIIYHDRKGRENPWRKHQTSSIARDIWLYDRQTGVHKQVTTFNGEDRSPVFAGTDTAIYYLSEMSGSFNVYEQSIASAPRPVTSFIKNPVRFLSISRDRTLCMGYDGEIYCKKKNAAPVKVRVIIQDDPEEKEEVKISMGDVREMTVSPSGREVAFICHGEVFVSSTAGKELRRVTWTPEEEAGLSFSPDGRQLIYASERGNRWTIIQAVLDPGSISFSAPGAEFKEMVLIENEQENYQPQYSPQGSEIAYIENRTTLKVYNIPSRKSRLILTSDKLYSRRDNDQYFKWSPDGKWLLVQYTEQGAGNDEVGMVCADGKGGLINLTQSGFNDNQPKWAMGGGVVLWQSDRNGLRSYAGSATRQHDVYALFLDQKGWADFRRQDSTAKATGMSFGGVAGMVRRVRLTRQSALMTDALLSANGRTLYHLARSAEGIDLWQTDLHTHRTKLLSSLAASDAIMDWDGAQNSIFILAEGSLIKIDPATAQQQTIYTGDSMTGDRAAERRSMFEHVWRRVDETFYTSGLHGVDWTGYRSVYEKCLPDIGNNYDLAELLNEMLGELNVSHTGATYRPVRKEKDVTASLGAFYNPAYKDTGVQITEVVQDGPLDDPALGIVPGTIIEAIDGLPVLPDRDLAQYLNRKAGKNAELILRDGRGQRKVVIRPISPDEESELLYQRWVNRNRRETDSLSHGELGYIHLYRMNDAAYRKVYEEVLGRYAGRKGLVVDTRFNRGGDLAPELTMFLSGARIRDNVARSFLLGSEPSFRWTRPSIVLACEANYSDGDCFVYDYQYLHMGKFVGMPVPGSCTFQTGQSLVDGTMQWSVPTLGVKDLGGSFLENHQSEPDIRVMNEPGKVSAGRDQQLETAIQVLLGDLR